jgi:hypothetical protein
MELLEVLHYLRKTVPAGYWELFLYQQLLILLESNETLPLELLRLLEQSMIMMLLNCSHDPPASATEGSPAVFEFSLSNPSAVQ